MNSTVRVDYHVEYKAVTGISDECGDLGLARGGLDSDYFFALIDALGHGKEAHNTALIAEQYLMAHDTDPLVDMVSGLHRALKGSRGAVAAVCRICCNTGFLCYSGMGNISLKILGRRYRRLMVREGILGYMISTPRVQEIPLFPGDILIMTSDGIREHFDPDAYPDIFSGSASDIAAGIMDHLGKRSDDASCIVVRYGV